MGLLEKRISRRGRKANCRQHSGSEIQEACHRSGGEQNNGAAHEETPHVAHVHQKGPNWR